MARGIKPKPDPSEKLTLKAIKHLKETDASYEVSDLSDSTKMFHEELNIRTVPDLIHALQKQGSTVDIDARVLHLDKKNKTVFSKRLDRQGFVEAYKRNARKKTFKESIDGFGGSDLGSSLVGNDVIPLLGGPFNKQLYYYDYLKMHAQCFYAYNHDPIAKASVEIICNFVLGRGWRVDCNTPQAQALWDAFAEANNLSVMVEQFVKELSIYGEQMVWWLPDNAQYISYDVYSNQLPSKEFLPRIRLIDPSVIWEIVTYPEDITRVLYYQWVAPTQYQIYTGSDKDKPVPGMKFIYQQIPDAQVDHYKINCASNEKRGRSDLFPALGFMKRLRDSVNYSIIALQKTTAWSIDTTVDGNIEDINDYIQSQKDLGSIPQAGSEFVHSKKITRSYMSNEGAARGSNSTAFDWCLSMVATALGIPISYYSTHLSGGSTRASAVVATEPVAKKFEQRRQVVEAMLTNCATELFKKFGLEDVEVEITFPELIVQDRSAKLKDLALAVSEGWLSNERAAEITAKELGINKYDYKLEMEKIKAEKASGMTPLDLTPAPLTAPGAVPAAQPTPEIPANAGNKPVDPKAKNNGSNAMGMAGADKKSVKDNNGF